MNLQQCRDKINQLVGRRKHLKEDRELLEEKIKGIKQSLENHSEALLIAQFLANQVQENLEYKISNIVTIALETIWDDPYKFQTVFDINYGKTTARLELVREGNIVEPKEASGGGVVEVVCFALRLAMHTLNPNKSANMYFLDEPFRFIEKPKQQKLMDLVNMLCEKLKVQVIMITHEPELVIGSDNVICLGNDVWKKKFLV